MLHNAPTSGIRKKKGLIIQQAVIAHHSDFQIMQRDSAWRTNAFRSEPTKGVTLVFWERTDFQIRRSHDKLESLYITTEAVY